MPSARGYNNVPKLARLTTQRNPVPAANHRSRSCYAGCQPLAERPRALRIQQSRELRGEHSQAEAVARNLRGGPLRPNVPRLTALLFLRIKLPVTALNHHQVIVASALNNAPILHDHDILGVAHRRKPMRHHDLRALILGNPSPAARSRYRARWSPHPTPKCADTAAKRSQSRCAGADRPRSSRRRSP